MGILAAAEFAVISTTNGKKVYTLAQFALGRDMNIPIKHMVDWELIRQKNQIKTNKGNIRKNRHRVDHAYKVGDNVIQLNTLHSNMKRHTQAYCDKTLFYQWNGYLQNGTTQITYNIHRIKPYNYDTKVEDYS